MGTENLIQQLGAGGNKLPRSLTSESGEVKLGAARIGQRLFHAVARGGRGFPRELLLSGSPVEVASWEGKTGAGLQVDCACIDLSAVDLRARRIQSMLRHAACSHPSQNFNKEPFHTLHRHYSKMMAKWKTIFESQLQAFLRQIQQLECEQLFKSSARMQSVSSSSQTFASRQESKARYEHFLSNLATRLDYNDYYSSVLTGILLFRVLVSVFIFPSL